MNTIDFSPLQARIGRSDNRVKPDGPSPKWTARPGCTNVQNTGMFDCFTKTKTKISMLWVLKFCFSTYRVYIPSKTYM